MGEAIETTQKLYPGLLERDLNLLFMLKCRQFIEMVNGTDSEVLRGSMRSPRSRHGSGSTRSSPSMSPVHGGRGLYDRSSTHGSSTTHGSGTSLGGGTSGVSGGSSSPSQIITKSHSASPTSHPTSDLHSISEANMNATNSALNGSSHDQDVDMQESSENGRFQNGNSSNGVSNGVSADDHECDMGK